LSPGRSGVPPDCYVHCDPEGTCHPILGKLVKYIPSWQILPVFVFHFCFANPNVEIIVAGIPHQLERVGLIVRGMGNETTDVKKHFPGERHQEMSVSCASVQKEGLEKQEEFLDRFVNHIFYVQDHSLTEMLTGL
jgi:hypothetical protein